MIATQVAHSERAHALLSASGADRYTNCTPSARYEMQFPDVSSEYADEGTLAHEIAELYARKYFIEPIGPIAFMERLTQFQDHRLYQKEMLTHAETYVDQIKQITHNANAGSYVVLETRLDYSSYAQEGFGTVDCLVITGDTLTVIDYKYGKGVPVPVEGKAQLRVYALAALLRYRMIYDIKKVQMKIVQPRLESFPSEIISTDDLLA